MDDYNIIIEQEHRTVMAHDRSRDGSLIYQLQQREKQYEYYRNKLLTFE